VWASEVYLEVGFILVLIQIGSDALKAAIVKTFNVISWVSHQKHSFDEKLMVYILVGS